MFAEVTLQIVMGIFKTRSESRTNLPDAWGTRWLEAQVLHVFTTDIRCSSGRAPTYTWGTTAETCTTLSMLFDGDPVPKEMHFSWAMIQDCGAGHRMTHRQALAFIRRALKRLGLLP
jgi:hypothetical protein